MVDFTGKIEEYYKKEADVLNKLDKKALNETMNCLYRHYLHGDDIYVFGNGGSAATASHMVCDFDKGICSEVENRFRFICLNDNMPILTAISNDVGYEDIFFYQLENKIRKTDAVLAISGSGNSKNVIKAVEYAKKVGADVIGMTGYDGGKLDQLSDYHLHCPIDDMQITEDIHMSFDHMMMHIFWEYVMAENGKKALYKKH
jgi:D-sedoheptulose 7-phosphate isomerase